MGRFDLHIADVRRSRRVNEDRFRIKPLYTRYVDRCIDHFVRDIIRWVIVIVIRRSIVIVAVAEKQRGETDGSIEPVRFVIVVVTVDVLVAGQEDPRAGIIRTVAVEKYRRDLLNDVRAETREQRKAT